MSSGSMVILLPGMYTVDRRSRAMASRADSRPKPMPGAAMWMPTRQPASVGVIEKASSISVVAASSMEKARTAASGRSVGSAGASTGGKPVPAGKYSNRKRSKCSSWVTPARRSRATGGRRLAGFGAGGFEGLGFEAVAVGLVEQLADQRAELFGQRAGEELVAHALDGGGLLLLFLEAGEGGLEDFGGGLAEAAAALAVEVDRRGVEAQQHGGGFDRAGFVAEVFAGEVDEGEFVVAADFPQELGVEAFGLGFGALQQLARRGLGEAHQNVVALQFEALAVGRFHLQGGVVVGQDGAGLEGTILFEEQIHGVARLENI
jgi:hypothetical protein